MANKAISGLAITGVAAGAVVAYSAISNSSITDTLSALLRGQKPTGKPSKLSQLRGGVIGDLGAAVGAQTAEAEKLALRALPNLNPPGGPSIGQPQGTAPPPQIVFSSDMGSGLGARIANSALQYLGVPYVWGGATPQQGFDCSGLVTWVLHHDIGINLPSNTHTVTGQFYVWGGATTVGRPPQAGDLICWPSHIAIALNATEMVSAPTAGKTVHKSNIYWTPLPLIRRVNGA